MNKLQLPDSRNVVPNPYGAGSPRLRIYHLLLWMSCSAACLTISHLLPEPVGILAAEDNESYAVWSGLTDILNGAAMAGAIVVIVARCTHRFRLPRAPGHWLLLAQASFTMAYELPECISLVLQNAVLIDRIGAAIYCLFTSLSAVVCAIAFWQRHHLCWKLVFGAFFILYALQNLVFLGLLTGFPYGGYGPLLFAIDDGIGWGMLISTVVLLFVAAFDQRIVSSRDFLHWTGIACYFGNLGIAMLYWAMG